MGGLGIGLTIVGSLIERHGGSVSARSDGPGKGSEFIVRLPAADRDPGAADRVPNRTVIRDATPASD
jgi:signal transduction histidine kinase